MAFAVAEMLADPSGPSTLADIENNTKRGHGLYTLDGASEGVQDIVVSVLRSASWSSMEGLFARTGGRSEITEVASAGPERKFRAGARTARWILVPRPPRERPVAWSAA